MEFLFGSYIRRCSFMSHQLCAEMCFEPGTFQFYGFSLPAHSFSLLPGIDRRCFAPSFSRSFPLLLRSVAPSIHSPLAPRAARGHENSHAGIQLPNERRLEGAPKIPRLEQVRYYRIDACDVAQIALIHLIFWGKSVKDLIVVGKFASYRHATCRPNRLRSSSRQWH